MKVFCGIDWSERHHDIALIDAEGELLAKHRIGDSLEGFTELLALLAEAPRRPTTRSSLLAGRLALDAGFQAHDL